MSFEQPTTGPVGSIARADLALQALAEVRDGSTFTEIMARTGFTRTTTHRVLASLIDVQYVFQDPGTRKYHLGRALSELSRTANQNQVAMTTQRSAQRIADASEDTVFVTVREGAASVCVLRAQGAFPIRTLTLEPGDRTPVGVGANAQALFATLPEKQRSAVASVNKRWMEDYNFTPELAADCFADFQKRGYAYNPSLAIPGMSAVGLPIVTSDGMANVSIAIGAINERMTLERIEDVLVPLLAEEVAHLSKRFCTLEQEGLA